jgi:hypothetical protein
MRTIVFFVLQEKYRFITRVRVRESFSGEQSWFSREKVNASRAFWMINVFALITLQERKRVHPNIVLVHDSLQESSFIDLLEVDMA